MKEEYLLTGPLETTNEWYAVAKIAGIKMCQAYRKQYGFNAISVMPINLYGPGDNFDLEKSHVLPALIRKFHLAKLAMNGDSQGIAKDENRFGLIPEPFRINLLAWATRAKSIHRRGAENKRNLGIEEFGDLGISPTAQSSVLSGAYHFEQQSDQIAQRRTGGPQSSVPVLCPQSPVPLVSLWGSGTPRREFLHVDDLAEACVFLMANYDSEEIVNVGVGEDQTIEELAEMVAEAVGYNGGISFDSAKPDGTPQKLLDVSRIRSLGWTPRIALPDGIRRTYEWYIREQ